MFCYYGVLRSMEFSLFLSKLRKSSVRKPETASKTLNNLLQCKRNSLCHKQKKTLILKYDVKLALFKLKKIMSYKSVTYYNRKKLRATPSMNSRTIDSDFFI